MGQSNLTADAVKEVNQDEPVAAPLSKFWVVEYHYNSDSFSVRTLPDYLTHAQTAFHERRLFDSVLLAIHPTEQGAREECNIWQKRRDERGLNVEERLAEFRRYVKGLESLL